MPLKTRALQVSQVAGKEVSSDGRVVWVNIHGSLAARFSPLNADFVSEGKVTSFPFNYLTFVTEVRHRYGVEVGEEHKPLYVE